MREWLILFALFISLYQAKNLENKSVRGTNEPDKRLLTADNSRPRVNQYTYQPWDNMLRQRNQQPNPILPEDPISQRLGQQRQSNILEDSFSSRQNQLSGSADNRRETPSRQNNKLRQATISKRTNSRLESLSQSTTQQYQSRFPKDDNPDILGKQDFESSYDRSYDEFSLPNDLNEGPYQGFNRQRASSSMESSNNLPRKPENSYLGYNSQELTPEPKTRSPFKKVLSDPYTTSKGESELKSRHQSVTGYEGGYGSHGQYGFRQKLRPFNGYGDNYGSTSNLYQGQYISKPKPQPSPGYGNGDGYGFGHKDVYGDGYSSTNTPYQGQHSLKPKPQPSQGYGDGYGFGHEDGYGDGYGSTTNHYQGQHSFKPKPQPSPGYGDGYGFGHDNGNGDGYSSTNNHYQGQHSLKPKPKPSPGYGDGYGFGHEDGHGDVYGSTNNHYQEQPKQELSNSYRPGYNSQGLKPKPQSSNGYGDGYNFPTNLYQAQHSLKQTHQPSYGNEGGYGPPQNFYQEHDTQKQHEYGGSENKKGCLHCPYLSTDGYSKEVVYAKDVKAVNIDFVAGIGGTLMAATAITADINTCEYSFTLGGYQSCLERLTVASLLETVNHHLRGIAYNRLNKGYLYAIGQYGLSEGLEAQAEVLVKDLKEDSQAKQDQWKLIFLMPLEFYICGACPMAGYDGHGVNLDQLDAFKSDLKKAFNHLLSLRNVIIYTIPFPDIGDILDLDLSSCSGDGLKYACPCIHDLTFYTGTDKETLIETFLENIAVYQEAFTEIVTSFKTSIKDWEDAGIIVGNPWKHTKTMFPSLDSLANNCFNWGVDLNAAAAALVWNDMWSTSNGYSTEIDVEFLDTENIISGWNSQRFRLLCPYSTLIKDHQSPPRYHLY
ncbi:uncharacterized protein LOC111716199 isoform X5 [Eurytemora carolleeae]|uniref:uncharacterized protein LOC111716199 isoform X5 n=1 Tax=Eurytemora carolleeae TaxID=1294199 RepID=UPI000C77B100|nr:uncharacterized protein LOC111716199 isoform X5 [Eurytemora carolleeae]|eukprot:XP_023347402.1 uncharacterized protein LOC111716199 isoform X5 [Eurytemora affinis]